MSTPERTEDAFFAALVDGDAGSLEELLTDDFVIVDVMSGSVFDRSSFVAAVGQGAVTFAEIDVVERSSRQYADAAIVIGRTAMRGAVGDEPTEFGLASRYTHVFVRGGDDRWRLASAQGTPIAEGV
jgi:ketosteroid isomerase-like protein